MCNSVLKQYWGYRISRAYHIDLINQNFLSELSEGLWYFTMTLCMCLQRLSTFKWFKNMPSSIFNMFYTIDTENTENFILGPKPPGPNRGRVETSIWGRTWKGPKPLATPWEMSYSTCNLPFLYICLAVQILWTVLNKCTYPHKYLKVLVNIIQCNLEFKHVEKEYIIRSCTQYCLR